MKIYNQLNFDSQLSPPIKKKGNFPKKKTAVYDACRHVGHNLVPEADTCATYLRTNSLPYSCIDSALIDRTLSDLNSRGVCFFFSIERRKINF